MIETRHISPRSFKDRYLAWFIKWMPDSFVICLALTLVVALLAWALTDTPAWSWNPDEPSLVTAWTGAFWTLLKFTMQMTVLLATGHAVAASPPATRVLMRLASLPRTRTQMILLGAVFAGLLGYVHWGLGMMGGIVLGKELLAQARRKNIKIHMPALVSGIFTGLLPGAAGISGAAVLYAATPGYLKNLVPDQYKNATPESVPLSETVLRPDFVALLAVSMVVAVAFIVFMHPKRDDQIREMDDDFLAEIEATRHDIVIQRDTPAQRANASRVVMYVVGGLGLVFVISHLLREGLAALDLDTFNFLFLTLGMVLCAHWGPEYYGTLIKEGVQGTWGFILQFPFYAGIFGLISATGLGVVISHFFTTISTPTTWPIVAFLYSGLLNIAVPSGGSKFIIEAPYIIPTTIDQGVDLGLILQAYQMGDSTTNLLIPFFCLPYLANFKLKFGEIVGFTVPPVLIIIGVTCLYLLVRAMYL